MKKWTKCMAAVAAMAAVLAFLFGSNALARITTADSTDVWCVGISGAEVCVDSSGNLLPTTDNDTTMGTSSLRWATVHALDATIGDDLTVTDALTVNGNTTLGDTLADTLDLNVTTVTINATATGLSITSATSAGTSIIRINGLNANPRVGILNNAPTTALDVTGTITTTGLDNTGNSTLGDAAGDTLTLNLSTAIIRSDANGVKIGTSATDGTYIAHIDGSNRTIGINVAASSTIGLRMDVLNASTTGQVVNGAASATADLAQFQVDGSTKVVIGAQGHLAIPVYTVVGVDTLTSDRLWSMIMVTNHPGYTAGVICVSSGTAASQFEVMGSTGGLHMSGCGSGE